MKKILLLLILASLLSINTLNIYAEPLNLDLKSYILIDSKSGNVLYKYNIDEKLFPASTTKIMTAVIAIEKGDLNKMMKASTSAINDIGKDGMNIGILPDEEIRLGDLLNALLISSANETANIIAENICATRSEFVTLMNNKAHELGAENTNFVNPCGAHDPNHYTTASDLAKIARYAMTLPKFREIVGQKTYSMSATNKHTSWPQLSSTNKLLWRTSNYFSQVTGIKTGYTGPAGFNLVSSAKNNEGMELISVTLGAETKGTEFNGSKQLLEYGFQNFSTQKIVDSNQLIENVAVSEAENNTRLDLVAQSEISAVLPIDKSILNMQLEKHINPNITAPVKQGDVLGYVEYVNNGISLGKVNIIASQAINQSMKASVVDTAKNTASNPFLKKFAINVIIFAIAFVLLRSTLRKISRLVNARKHQSE